MKASTLILIVLWFVAVGPLVLLVLHYIGCISSLSMAHAESSQIYAHCSDYFDPPIIYGTYLIGGLVMLMFGAYVAACAGNVATLRWSVVLLAGVLYAVVWSSKSSLNGDFYPYKAPTLFVWLVAYGAPVAMFAAPTLFLKTILPKTKFFLKSAKKVTGDI